MRKALFFLFLCTSLFAHSQPVDTSKIDALFAAWNKPTVPGGAVSIIRNNQVIFSKGYGLADLEHRLPITSSSVFYIASTGKQFTAFCILLLEEQGKLQLTDNIQKYLPDFPSYDKPITIAHLVHHTSGLRDYSTLWDLTGRNYLDHMPHEEVYQLIKSQRALNFTPGETYSYSNSCYLLMGMIVAKISGKSLKEFAQENIFAPLGMKHTLFFDDNRTIIAGYAHSYEKVPKQDSFYNVIRRFDLVGSGGVYSSVEDLALWDQNFYHNKLGKGTQELVKKMEETGFFNDSTKGVYGFGLEMLQYKGLRTVTHSGSHASYRAQILRFPDQQFSVIVLANRSDATGEGEAYAVADIFLKDKFISTPVVTLKSAKAKKPFKLPSKELQQFTGAYMNDARGYSRKIIVKNDTLYYARSATRFDQLLPAFKNEFNMVGMEDRTVRLRFNKDSLFYFSDGRLRETMIRYEPKTLTEQELQRFQGIYYGKDINCHYKLLLEQQGLVLSINNRKIATLQSVSASVLTDGLNMYYFTPDKKSFKLTNTRVKDLFFQLQEGNP